MAVGVLWTNLNNELNLQIKIEDDYMNDTVNVTYQ